MKKKFIFIVQGEGRGHMTQAVTLFDLLMEKGHEIPCIFLGSTGNRPIPDFVKNKFGNRLIQIQTPCFQTDDHQRKVNIPATVLFFLMNFFAYVKSIRTIHSMVKKNRPDVIINFFELLGGLYFRLYSPSCKCISIAHQYIYLYPEFKFPPGKFFQKMAVKIFTRLTTSPRALNLALSFYPLKESKSRNVKIMPPLLRKEIFSLKPIKEPLVVIYLVNPGYLQDLLKQVPAYPSYQFICFLHLNAVPEEIRKSLPPNLILHEISDKEFLDALRRSSGFLSTAGFESICESIYLQKPFMAIPIEGHFEQYCNSIDASRTGHGIPGHSFNLFRFMYFCSTFEVELNGYHSWVKNAPELFYEEIINC